jgi:hypothetical protein
MAISHANCSHPRTPAGRRACRKVSLITDPNLPTQIAADRLWKDIISRPRMPQKPVRIQPRRSGARVSTTDSACVQAALHTRGKCACGWENWEAVA